MIATTPNNSLQDFPVTTGGRLLATALASERIGNPSVKVFTTHLGYYFITANPLAATSISTRAESKCVYGTETVAVSFPLTDSTGATYTLTLPTGPALSSDESSHTMSPGSFIHNRTVVKKGNSKGGTSHLIVRNRFSAGIVRDTGMDTSIPNLLPAIDCN